MKTSVKVVYDSNLFYVYCKKHFCPVCKTRLKIGCISKTVNSKSPEAKNYDFSNGDTFLTGDVKFRIKCFYCQKCERLFSFQEMKEYEKTER